VVAAVCGRISAAKVVTGNNPYTAETERLRDDAAELRVRAVDSQLSAVLTLCGIAESKIRYGQPDEAVKLLQKLQHHAETIRFHIHEPNHLPSSAISDRQERLMHLEKRIQAVKSRLRQR